MHRVGSGGFHWAPDWVHEMLCGCRLLVCHNLPYWCVSYITDTHSALCSLHTLTNTAMKKKKHVKMKSVAESRLINFLLIRVCTVCVCVSETLWYSAWTNRFLKTVEVSQVQFCSCLWIIKGVPWTRLFCWLLAHRVCRGMTEKTSLIPFDVPLGCVYWLQMKNLVSQSGTLLTDNTLLAGVCTTI